MPVGAKVWMPDGVVVEVVVGEKNVRNIFPDKDDSNTLVVLNAENIVTYTGMPYILVKEYKVKEG